MFASTRRATSNILPTIAHGCSCAGQSPGSSELSLYQLQTSLLESDNAQGDHRDNEERQITSVDWPNKKIVMSDSVDSMSHFLDLPNNNFVSHGFRPASDNIVDKVVALESKLAIGKLEVSFPTFRLPAQKQRESATRGVQLKFSLQ